MIWLRRMTSRRHRFWLTGRHFEVGFSIQTACDMGRGETASERQIPRRNLGPGDTRQLSGLPRL